MLGTGALQHGIGIGDGGSSMSAAVCGAVRCSPLGIVRSLIRQMHRNLQIEQETPAEHSSFIARELADSAWAFVPTGQAVAPLFADMAEFSQV